MRSLVNLVRGHVRAEFILFDGHIQPGFVIEPQFFGNIVTRKLELVFPDKLERDLAVYTITETWYTIPKGGTNSCPKKGGCFDNDPSI